MKAKFYPREAVITEATTDYDLVVLEAVDEFRDTVGDNVSIRRNPNLTAQLNAVKGWGVPVLLRVVSNAQWYCDLIKSMTDEPGWTEAMNKLTIDATSAMIGVSRSAGVPADGLIITSWKDDTKGTTSTWVKLVMEHLLKASEKWGLPIWMEFPAVIDAAWDNKQLQVFRDNLGEYAIRNSTKPTLASAEIEMPWNTMSYLPEHTHDVPVPDPDPDPPAEWIPEDDLDKALLCLPSIDKKLDAVLIYLDSIQKLIEAQAPWRKQ